MLEWSDRSFSDMYCISRRVPMAAGAEGRANMVFTQVTIGLLGRLRDVVRLVPELLSPQDVAPFLAVAGAV